MQSEKEIWDSAQAELRQIEKESAEMQAHLAQAQGTNPAMRGFCAPAT
ncbi:MAG TPA: hypothetical protein VJ464_24655 [Blastocatellia bacterium]|nr:hypothetical protein [Blastocatellia bacterium]